MWRNGILVESYTYDPQRNRLTEENLLRGVALRDYTYSDEDHLITAGTESYQFNVDGFLDVKTTVEGVTDYNYSSRGELLQVTKPDGKVVGYDHDPLGRRIAKRVDGTVTERYLWRDETTLLAVYDGSGSLRSRFVYAEDRMPVSMVAGGSTYYLAYDQVGSLRAVMDSTGTIVKHIEYDSFGSVLSDSNPGLQVPFGFAGGLHDVDTGLVRFGARDYDPAVGRWMAKDPIEFDGGDANLYGYVVNNPLTNSDPFGLACVGPIWESTGFTQSYGHKEYRIPRANVLQFHLKCSKCEEVTNIHLEWGRITVGLITLSPAAIL